MFITVRNIFYIVVLASFFGCSLSPEKSITINTLMSSTVAYYIIEDEMEGVLTVLNRDGEAVAKASYLDKPVFVKIFATVDENKGNRIIVQQFDADSLELNQ